jgi:hypothetical protein
VDAVAYRGGGNVLLSGSAGDAAGFRNGNEKLDRYDVIGLHEAGERSSIGFARSKSVVRALLVSPTRPASDDMKYPNRTTLRKFTVPTDLLSMLHLLNQE